VFRVSDQVPFHFVLELCFFAFLITMAFRWVRLNKKQNLTALLAIHGLNDTDLVKIPKKTRETWEKNGVSNQEFIKNYRSHVENSIAH
jgi:hypothetical protein